MLLGVIIGLVGQINESKYGTIYFNRWGSLTAYGRGILFGQNPP